MKLQIRGYKRLPVYALLATQLVSVSLSQESFQVTLRYVSVSERDGEGSRVEKREVEPVPVQATATGTLVRSEAGVLRATIDNMTAVGSTGKSESSSVSSSFENLFYLLDPAEAGTAAL